MPRKVSAALLGAIIAILVVPGSAGALLTLGVTTKSPKDVAARSVTLNAEVTVSVLGAAIYWQYGPTTAYGSTTGSVSSSLVGVKETVALPLSGLTPDTTYHVRAVAVGGLTTAYGKDVNFKTPKAKPDDDGGTTTPPTTTPGTTPSTDDPPSPSADPDDAQSTPATPTITSSSSSQTGKDTTSGHDRTEAAPDDNSSDDDGVDTPPSVDPAADVPRGEATAAVTPVLGRTLAVAAVQGKVTATSPSGAPVDLSAAKAVPSGTLIDARAGTVELTTALDRKGTTQTGRFWGGRFEVRQSATDRGLTQLVLRGGDFGACPRGRLARSAAVAGAAKVKAKKKPSRSLWGSDDHGRFQTHGRGSVATVRGTRWLTQDTCQGTLTRVAAGAVAVKDLRTRRTVVVRQGRQYRARVAP
jgi:hypothetical protein